MRRAGELLRTLEPYLEYALMLRMQRLADGIFVTVTRKLFPLMLYRRWRGPPIEQSIYMNIYAYTKRYTIQEQEDPFQQLWAQRGGHRYRIGARECSTRRWAEIDRKENGVRGRRVKLKTRLQREADGSCFFYCSSSWCTKDLSLLQRAPSSWPITSHECPDVAGWHHTGTVH